MKKIDELKTAKDRMWWPEFLQKAIRHLQSGWTQGAYARDRSSNEVAPSNPAAACWCVTGALSKAMRTRQGVSTELHEFVNDRVEQSRGMRLPEWNDHCDTTKDDVLFMLRGLVSELESATKESRST